MPARIFLNGCQGRMGRMIRSFAAESGDCIVAGADIGPEPDCPFPLYRDPRQCQESFDVIIDFSNPAALPALIDLAERRLSPLVVCTTGLDDAIKTRLDALADHSAVFISANMSLGINLLINLARQAARLLYPGFDIEIIEAHHNQKLDAPSGTALMIADQINDALGGALVYTTDRSQVHQKRDGRELGIHAIRGGTIVGEHTVLLAGPEETIEIRHQAQSRAVFARGALAAARYMIGKPAGRYQMADLVASDQSGR